MLCNRQIAKCIGIAVVLAIVFIGASWRTRQRTTGLPPASSIGTCLVAGLPAAGPPLITDVANVDNNGIGDVTDQEYAGTLNLVAAPEVI